MNTSELARAVREAATRIEGHARRTPAERSGWLSDATGAEVFVKLENHQVTGSFKVRGALNKVLLMGAEAHSLVTASTGNHGAAMAFAAALTGSQVTVFVPESADSGKRQKLERLGARVQVAGAECVDAEAAAREFSAAGGGRYISPYNDLEVVAGQGTLGLEIAEDLPETDTVLLALGGGGLVAGCAAALKAHRNDCEIIACSAANSAVMMASVQAGRILDMASLPTLSDGTAGGVETGAVTFELCRELVDRYEAVSEEQIRSALVEFLGHHHSLIEGAAALGVATVLALGRQLEGRRVAVVVCGANLATETLRELLNRH